MENLYSISTAILWDMSVHVTDITDIRLYEEKLRNSLSEKETLLKEIHHRVKNNLQIISSLLSLELNYIKDEDDLKIFKESQNRVKSMAMIHEKLYRSKDLSRIDFSEYIRELTSYIYESYIDSKRDIKFELVIENVFLEINPAIPCGLIINELVTNSLKYAFTDGRKGKIRIKFYKSKKNVYYFSLNDNGIGLPVGFDINKTKTFGLSLVNDLVSQLEGVIQIKSDINRGTSVKFHFSPVS